ncbi:MAG: primosomal protein N', partial [Sphingomonadales bacterium]|nr:primosomal protein N' [Sphingomonadales bacterium]
MAKAQKSPISGTLTGRVAVMLPVPVDGPLDYLSASPVAIGSFVKVEMGRRTLVGVVWGEGLGDFDEKKLKPLGEVLPLPPLPDEHREFINWVAAYTISPPGMVLKMTLSAPDAFGPPPSRTLYKKSGSTPEKLTPKRQACMDVIKDFKPRSVAAIATMADVSDAVVRGLVKAGAFIPVEVTEEIHFPEPDANLAGPTLNDEQQIATTELIKRVDEDDYSCSLLEGVTGSGKTEVYFEMIAHALNKGSGQILVLVPEIALTSQWLDRFETRFGARPVEWHSDLGVNERRRAWLSILTGEARVVVGARSALFLPYQKLDLIVADEEHDPSFKQEDGVLYNARDMAVVRASLAKCPIALASATPSFETLVNAQEGRYHHLTLTQRHGVADLPEMIPIDMRSDGPPTGRWIAPALVEAIEAATARGEQS